MSGARIAGLLAVAVVLGVAVILLVRSGEDAPEGPALSEAGQRGWPWGLAEGEARTGPIRGAVILLHGGGWRANPAGHAEQQAIAPLYRRLGYLTRAVAYRGGRLGLRDVEAVYSKLRSDAGPDLPICAIGASAGGHLALMLAAREPDLTCAIDLAGPTDLTSLLGQGAVGAHRLAVMAFGRKALARFSPVRHADAIEADLLLIFADTDPVIPSEQGEEMARAVPGADLITLPPGEGSFIHGPGVDAAASAAAGSRQLEFLTEAMP